MENTSPHGVPDDLITPREAAALLHVHLATVYRLCADGRLACWTRAGTRKFVSRAAVLGLYQPPANVPAGRVPSHQEAVERLQKQGWM